MEEIYSDIKKLILEISNLHAVQEQMNNFESKSIYTFFMNYVDLIIEGIVLQIMLYGDRKLNKADIDILNNLTEYNDILMFFNINETWNTLSEVVENEKFKDWLDTAYASDDDKICYYFGLVVSFGTFYIQSDFDSIIKIKLTHLALESITDDAEDPIKTCKRMKCVTDYIEKFLWLYVKKFLGTLTNNSQNYI